jgi:phytoene dehydrogenase-like protein
VTSAIRERAREKSYDAAVVGSGPNGFAAAITLARQGLSVLLVEASETVGGGLRSAELTLPGFVHDVCSAIHPTALVSPFFRSLSLAEHGLEWAFPEVPLAHPLPDGSAALLEADIEATARGLGEDGKAWRALHGMLTERADDLFPALLGPLRLPRSPLLLARFGLSAIRSASALARSRFRGAPARALFGGCAAHSFLPLDRATSAAYGLVLSTAAHAVGWPCARGGSQRIADALTSVLRSLGGEIVTGARVTSIDELPEARAILLDVSPSALARLCADRLPAGYRQRLDRFRHGPGVFKVDWALSAPIPWRASACARAGTVHLGGPLDELEASERACWTERPSESPFVLVAQQSLFDSTRAPKGKHTGWAYCHVPHGCTIDMTETIERQMERFAPGFRDLILARETRSPARLERDNANYVGGDICGGSNEALQLFARPVAAPVPYATPNRQLYLCSSSTPPGGGVHGMSGFYAARAALRRVFGRKIPAP